MRHFFTRQSSTFLVTEERERERAIHTKIHKCNPSINTAAASNLVNVMAGSTELILTAKPRRLIAFRNFLRPVATRVSENSTRRSQSVHLNENIT